MFVKDNSLLILRSSSWSGNKKYHAETQDIATLQVKTLKEGVL